MTHIQKLPQDVINRIAAGEVVQRPSAALKELLENALDAGSTSIQVTAQDGGLEMLQVCDDGSGIHLDDLPLLCERYATSKLRHFDDLQSIASFGFRGEALASLSYVAKVTVTTKSRHTSTPTPAAPESSSSGTVAATSLRHHADVGWRATYLDGQLTQPAQACAGNFGTVIRAERMFYNAAVRRGALRPSEEWSRVVDVVSRYALAFPHVGFSCTRDGAAGHQNGVVFPKQSDTLRNIRISHGNAVASHLHPIFHYDESTAADVHAPPSASGTPGHADAFARVASAAKRVQSLRGTHGEGMFTVAGFASDSTLLNRKAHLCLFINNRLVESYAIRKCMDAVYSGVLTGGNKPFVVLFVTVPAERLDVNVHPTKKEVCLLDEELILAKLAELLRACVLQAANVRQLDMLKLQNTTAAALKAFHPNVRQGPSATSSASAQQTLDMLSHQSGVDPRDETVGSQQGSTPTSSSAEILSILHSRASRGVAPSPLTSSSAPNNSTAAGGGASSTGTLAGFGKGNGGVVIAPCTVVRVEAQKGALDAFFSRPKPPTTPVTTTFTLHTPSSPAASSLARPNAVEICDDANGEDGDETTPRESCAAQDWQRVLDSIRPAGAAVEVTGASATNLTQDEVTDKDHEIKEGHADTATPMTATPATTTPSIAALGGNEEEEEDDEDRDALMRDFQQFRERTAQPQEESTTFIHDVDRPGGVGTVQRTGDLSPSAPMATSDTVIGVPEVETHVLTSVAAVVEGLQLRSSAATQAFFQHLALVGLVDANAFMAQSGTSLYLIDTLRLVREVTFQRFFLRWADPGLPRMPSLVLATPQPIEALLLFALKNDAVGMETAGVPPPTSLREAASSAQKEKLSASRKRPRESGQDALESTTAERPTLDALLLAAACPPVGRSETPRGLRDCVTSETPTEQGDVASATYTQLAAALFAVHENLNKASQNDATGQGDTPLPPPAGQYAAPRRAPTRSARRYVRSLSRRLRMWRDMLSEYFGVVLSAQGEVVALPYVLNTAWPPNLRALPLLLWLLAEAVPYPSATTAMTTMTRAETETAQRRATSSDASLNLCDQPATSARTSSLSLAPPWESSMASLGAEESSMTQEASEAARAVEEEVQCFTAIAKHISDTLYGITSLPMTAPASAGGATTTTTGAAPHAPVNNTATWIAAASPAMPVVTAQEGIDMALMPCLKSKRLFYPPAVLLSDGTVQSIVSVESLYKVFERC